MKMLGKLSGQARNRPRPERVHPSLRDYLRREVAPARIWRALELALEGGSEAARVSASKVLMDALADRDEDDPRKQMQLQIKEAADKFSMQLHARAERQRGIRRQELAGILEPVGMEELADEEELVIVRALASRCVGLGWGASP
jgi:hypothetical protein